MNDCPKHILGIPKCYLTFQNRLSRGPRISRDSKIRLPEAPGITGIPKRDSGCRDPHVFQNLDLINRGSVGSMKRGTVGISEGPGDP